MWAEAKTLAKAKAPVEPARVEKERVPAAREVREPREDARAKVVREDETHFGIVAVILLYMRLSNFN